MNIYEVNGVVSEYLRKCSGLVFSNSASKMLKTGPTDYLVGNFSCLLLLALLFSPE